MKIGNFCPAADPNIIGGADVVITDKETGVDILFRVSVGMKHRGEHYLIWPKCEIQGFLQPGVQVFSDKFANKVIKKIVHESVGGDARFALEDANVV